MGRLTRIAVLALIITAVVGGALRGTKDAAANGQAQWVGYPDGCYYLSDGYDFVLGACPRLDGGFNYYAPSAGQWAYVGSFGYLSDGGTWVYYQGIYYYDTVSGYVNGVYPTVATGGNMTWEGLTNNPVANQFFIGARTDGGTWTTPTCIYTYQGICVI